DRGMLLGVGPAEGNIHRPWAPADHVALVPAIDAGAERLRPRCLMSAGRRERQQRCEQAEAATPPGSTQGSSRRSRRTQANRRPRVSRGAVAHLRRRRPIAHVIPNTAPVAKPTTAPKAISATTATSPPHN